MAMTAEAARKLSDQYREEIKNLEKEYGTGVRPSWVSTDVAIARQRSKYYAVLARDIEHGN